MENLVTRAVIVIVWRLQGIVTFCTTSSAARSTLVSENLGLEGVILTFIQTVWNFASLKAVPDDSWKELSPYFFDPIQEKMFWLQVPVACFCQQPTHCSVQWWSLNSLLKKYQQVAGLDVHPLGWNALLVLYIFLIISLTSGVMCRKMCPWWVIVSTAIDNPRPDSATLLF